MALALALPLLPTLVALAVQLGSPVPLELGAGAGLAILAGVKIAALVSALAGSAQAPSRVARALRFD